MKEHVLKDLVYLVKNAKTYFMLKMEVIFLFLKHVWPQSKSRKHSNILAQLLQRHLKLLFCMITIYIFK